jgi:heptaprenyl diphosphate synthase
MLTPQPGRALSPERPGLALLGSLCLFLSAIEYLIPKPFPFMRIGLANLPLLLALDLFGARDFFLLTLLKVTGQGIVSGTLFSYVFLFSLAGTFSSAALMYVMRHAAGTKRAGFAGISCAGAMLSNGVQLVLARYFVFGAGFDRGFGQGLRFLVPPFLASGFISGTILGLFCEAFCRRSWWYAAHSRTGRPVGEPPLLTIRQESPPPPPTCRASEKRRLHRRSKMQRREGWNKFFNSGELFIAGLVMTLFFLFNPSPLFRVFQFLFFCFLAWLSGKKSRPLITALIMAGIVFFNLLAPYGKVLAQWGPLRITQGSLLAGLGKAVTLEGLVMLSAACVKSDLRLPGSLGLLLGESFRLLELLRNKRALIRRGRVLEGIDQMMLELEAELKAEPKAAPGGIAAGITPLTGRPKQKVLGLLLLAGMTAFTAAVGILAGVTR